MSGPRSRALRLCAVVTFILWGKVCRLDSALRTSNGEGAASLCGRAVCQVPGSHWLTHSSTHLPPICPSVHLLHLLAEPYFLADSCIHSFIPSPIHSSIQKTLAEHRLCTRPHPGNVKVTKTQSQQPVNTQFSHLDKGAQGRESWESPGNPGGGDL